MNIKAKKSLGQNFLQDENVLKKIANSIKTNEDDLIIEIGPGKGALTKYLQKKNSFLTCYEIDLRMKEILKKFENEKTQIIFQDFLKANIIEDHQKYNYKDIYVIANIPYYITTPIIKHILNQEKIKSMTLLVQKEVAERFTAKPKSKAYGSLTVYLNYYFNVTYLFDVSRTAFYPVPNVESAVVKFERKNEKSNLKNKEVFFKLINDSFKMKRKTLKNNLKGYEWDKIKNVLEENNLNENVRAEELSLKIFEQTANILS